MWWHYVLFLTQLSIAGALKVSVHQDHALVIDGEQRVYGWGDNGAGQVVASAGARVDVPTLVFEQPLAYDVCAGRRHSCVLLTNGTALCWGDNSAGQLSPNEPRAHVPSTAPTRVDTGQRIVDMVCGWAHTCVRYDAPNATSVHCWGDNSHMQLGSPDTTARSHIYDFGYRLFDMSRGALGNSTCVSVDLDNDPPVFRVSCWGDNRRGQLGLNRDDEHLPLEERWQMVRTIQRSPISQLSGGAEHFCVQMTLEREDLCTGCTSRTLNCWGSNLENQLGMSDSGTWPMVGTSEFTMESAFWSNPADQTPSLNMLGLYTTCVSTVNRTLVCFGRNDVGQAGRDDTLPATEFRADMPALDMPLPIVGGAPGVLAFDDGSLAIYGSNGVSLQQSLQQRVYVSGAPPPESTEAPTTAPPTTDASLPPPPLTGAPTPVPTLTVAPAGQDELPPIDSPAFVNTTAVAVTFDARAAAPDYTLRLVSSDRACLSQAQFGVHFTHIEEVASDGTLVARQVYPHGGYAVDRSTLAVDGQPDGTARSVELVEFRHTFANGAEFVHSNWVFDANTTLELGGRVRTVREGTHKLSVRLDGWPFADAASAGVEVVMQLAIRGDAASFESVDAGQDAAAYVFSDGGSVQLHSVFQDAVRIDGADAWSYGQTSARVEHGAGGPVIRVRLPRFERSIEYDPDFSLLVAGGTDRDALDYQCRSTAPPSSGNMGLIIGVTAGVAAGTVLLTLGIILFTQRKRVFSGFYQNVHRSRDVQIRSNAQKRFSRSPTAIGAAHLE